MLIDHRCPYFEQLAELTEDFLIDELLSSGSIQTVDHWQQSPYRHHCQQTRLQPDDMASSKDQLHMKA